MRRHLVDHAMVRYLHNFVKVYLVLFILSTTIFDTPTTITFAVFAICLATWAMLFSRAFFGVSIMPLTNKQSNWLIGISLLIIVILFLTEHHR